MGHRLRVAGACILVLGLGALSGYALGHADQHAARTVLSTVAHVVTSPPRTATTVKTKTVRLPSHVYTRTVFVPEPAEASPEDNEQLEALKTEQEENKALLEENQSNNETEKELEHLRRMNGE